MHRSENWFFIRLRTLRKFLNQKPNLATFEGGEVCVSLTRNTPIYIWLNSVQYSILYSNIGIKYSVCSWWTVTGIVTSNISIDMYPPPLPLFTRAGCLQNWNYENQGYSRFFKVLSFQFSRLPKNASYCSK